MDNVSKSYGNILTRDFFNGSVELCEKNEVCEIPSSIKKPITEIGSKAFYDWKNCKYIIIPPTVNKIASDAFIWENVSLIITNLDMSDICSNVKVLPYLGVSESKVLLNFFLEIDKINDKFNINSEEILKKRESINSFIDKSILDINLKEKQFTDDIERVNGYVDFLQERLEKSDLFSNELLGKIDEVVKSYKDDLVNSITNYKDDLNNSICEFEDKFKNINVEVSKVSKESLENLKKKCEKVIELSKQTLDDNRKQLEINANDKILDTKKKIDGIIDDAINKGVEKASRACPYKSYTIIINNVKKAKQDLKLVHHQFDDVVKLISMGFHPLLVGPAGCGKNVIIEQAAKALGLPFFYVNDVTEEHKVMGFVDANGTYRKTQFFQAFTQGGLMMIDELDNSNPSVLLSINSAIGTGYHQYVAFPDGNFYEKNENFHLVAAANTFGTGADMIYCGRNTLDGASINRFIPVYIDYDNELERSLISNTYILNLFWQVRDSIQRNKIRHVISTRNIVNADKMIESNLWDDDFIFDSTIIQGMSEDDLRMILNDIRDFNDGYIEKFIRHLSHRGIVYNEYKEKTKQKCMSDDMKTYGLGFGY